MIKRNGFIANFNIVFGNEEYPMLDYFDSVIYPALTSGISKASNGNEYRFMNIKITKNRDNIDILSGILVKKTVLEIKSDISDDGQLIEKDERYSSAPYSSFALNLLNHRMLYIPNQKGSPNIASFKSTLRYVVESFILTKNKELEDEQKIPDAAITVVGIPSVQTMDELLDNVRKINSLTLRFYPLNGDIDFSEAFGILATDMRKLVGSKKGEITYKSPTSIDGVKHILSNAGGTIEPVLKVVTKEGSKATLKDDELTEKYEFSFDDNFDLSRNSSNVIERMSGIDSLSFTNEKHNAIYQRNIAKIESVKQSGD